MTTASLVAIALVVQAGPGHSAAPPPVAQGPTVRQWKTLPAQEKRELLIGAVEGLMLASAAPDGDEVNVACLQKESIDDMETQVSASGTGNLVTAVLKASSC